MRRPWSSWTTPTRSRRPRRAPVGAALAALTLCTCSPTGPPGVDRDALDAAVSRAVGDPNTCVLIAEARSGKVYYRYNTATTCAREFPACDRPQAIKLADVLKATAKDRQPRQLSCNTRPGDPSRGVGWAAGPIAGTDLVYAAVMEGDRAFPGRMMAERLAGAFRRAKVSK